MESQAATSSLLGAALRIAALGAVSLAIVSGTPAVWPARAAMIGPAMKTIPPPALETLRRSLHEALDLVPAPDAPYVVHPEETKRDVESRAPWDAHAKVWARPARATAEHDYDLPGEVPEKVPLELRDFLVPIEVSVELNGECRFADLASEGGPPMLLPLKDATAVEVSATVPGAAQSRVAAMTPRQSEYRLTAITIFVGDPKVEASIRSAVKNRATPRIAPVSTSDPAEVHLIAIRIHGPRKPAEAIARRTPAATLRELLRR